MVKSGKTRSEKYAMKYDAYVNMLRSKHEHYSTILAFSNTAFQQYSIDLIINTVIETQNLAWGVRGRYHDLTLKLFWSGTDNLDDWLAQGISEAAYNQTKSLIIDLVNLFYLCAFPRSKLISSIFITPIQNEVPFTNMEDWLAEITSLSEQEANLLPTLPNTLSILNSQVCAHNVVNSIAAFLPSPTVAITDYGVYPSINISVGWLPNPEVFPVLNISVANPNTYNNTPTLNISVGEAP